MIDALGELKAIGAVWLLPPAAPLLLAAAGLLVRRLWLGRALLVLGLLSAWLLSCQAVAVWLSSTLLPATAPLTPAQLKHSDAQVVVVLGGGVQATAPEYGQPQPSASTAARLRYGVHLAHISALPMAFAGGVGWSNAGHTAPTEASTAQAFVAEYGLTLRWIDSQSRDTAENAAHLRDLLAPAGVRRIALVTHAWHLPRSRVLFEQAGFEVLPAPMGFVGPVERPLLDWLPSAHGLTASRQVLREWLAFRLVG